MSDPAAAPKPIGPVTWQSVAAFWGLCVVVCFGLALLHPLAGALAAVLAGIPGVLLVFRSAEQMLKLQLRRMDQSIHWRVISMYLGGAVLGGLSALAAALLL